MRDYLEARIILTGDQTIAQQYIGMARVELGRLQSYMGNLNSAERERQVVPGVTVRVSRSFGHNTIEIHAVPQVVPPALLPIAPLIEAAREAIELTLGNPCDLPDFTGNYFTDDVSIALTDMVDETGDLGLGGYYFYGGISWSTATPLYFGFTISIYNPFHDIVVDFAQLSAGQGEAIFAPATLPSTYRMKANVYNPPYAVCLEGYYNTDGSHNSAPVPGTTARLYYFTGTATINGKFQRKIAVMTWDKLGLFVYRWDPDLFVEWAYSDLTNPVSFQLVIAENKVTNTETGEVSDCDTLMGYFHKSLGFERGDNNGDFYYPPGPAPLAVVDLEMPNGSYAYQAIAKSEYSETVGMKDLLSNTHAILRFGADGKLTVPTNWVAV